MVGITVSRRRVWDSCPIKVLSIIFYQKASFSGYRTHVIYRITTTRSPNSMSKDSPFKPPSYIASLRRPIMISTNQIPDAHSTSSVAAQVMPIKVLPLSATTPISLPCLLTKSVILTITPVEIAEASINEKNASYTYPVSQSHRPFSGREGQTYESEHGVDHSSETTSEEDPDEGAEQSDARGRDADAVEDEHDVAGELDAVDAVLDGGWPFEVREVYAVLQLVLYRHRGIEVEG